jgi:hypothetical protein
MTISSHSEQIVQDLQQHTKMTQIGDRGAESRLNPYAVLIRYPGMTATVAEAKEAVHAMRRLRTILRRKLGLH